MSSKQPIIDLTYLNEISDGNDILIKDIIEMLFEQIPDYQQLLNDLYQKKDWINLGKTAHKTKSAILMIGMKELAEDLKKLEENAKEGKNINEYKEIIAKFVSDSNSAIKELQDIKKSRNY